MCIHILISCGLFHAIQVELCLCEFFYNVRCVQQWWEVWLKANYIKHWVQTKERWDAEIECIVTKSLGDGAWPISKRVKLEVGSSEALLLQI